MKKRDSTATPVNVIYKGEPVTLGRFGNVKTGDRLQLRQSEWDYIQREGHDKDYELTDAPETTTDGSTVTPDATLPTQAAKINWAEASAELLEEELDRDQLHVLAEEAVAAGATEKPKARASKKELAEFVFEQSKALGWR